MKTSHDTITILDTSVNSSNLGDFIIMDAVREHLSSLFENSMIYYSQTHDRLGKVSYKLIKNSDYSFIGGTNLISSYMNKYNQWKINVYDSMHLKNVLLMGVGWWQYQGNPNLYTKILLKRVLNSDMLHSVRDSYTERMLKSIGIKNVINTSCPTMWNLTETHCSNIPSEKGDSVLLTITDYNKDFKRDSELIKILSNNYSRVFFWPQGLKDLEYFNSINNSKNSEVLSPSIDALNRKLSNPKLSLDYVGTRLHAGIRALQNKRRSIIIGIDNRASEKSKDFNLITVQRDNISELNNLIFDGFETKLSIPFQNISVWKQQFQ